MIGNWPKGSKWRKWDLHVHSPASHAFAGNWNQFIIQLGNADCDVVGINDYFSIAGYKEVQRRLDDPGAGAEGNKPYREALEKLRTKTLLPVIEWRMNNIVLDKKGKSGVRINFHLIFSPAVAIDDVETFIKNLKVNVRQSAVVTAMHNSSVTKSPSTSQKPARRSPDVSRKGLHGNGTWPAKRVSEGAAKRHLPAYQRCRPTRSRFLG